MNRLADDTSEKPVIMMFNTGFLLAQLAEDPLMRADLSNFEYIGKVTSEARYLVAAGQSGLESWEDALSSQNELLMPAQAPNSSGFIQSLLIREAFGIKLKPLTGFSGSEARAAMAKGELQIDLVSENNVERLLKAGAAVPILRFGPASVEEFAAVRSADTVAETEVQKLVVGGISGMTRLGRIILASPGVPEDDLVVLRAAFLQAVSDPAFLAAAEEQGLALDPLDGVETKALILKILNAGGPFRRLVQQVRE